MKMKLALAASALLLAAACTQEEAAAPATPAAATPAEPAIPEAVNGWREYPLREGVSKTHPAEWKHEVIDIRVPKSEGLEYQLAMKEGDAIVYTVTYEGLSHAGLLTVEFHGHTDVGPDGIGDLMFYSRTGGTTEHGSLAAPWDGVAGWYFKNDSEADVVVRLNVAGFYERVDEE